MTRSVTHLSLVVILLSTSCSTPIARGHYTRGKALFDDIAAKDPGSWDFSKAIAEFSQAIRLKPDYVDAYHVRSLAYLITGSHARALEDLDEAIRLKTKIALSYMLRGMAWDHLGKKARAEADMKKARELGLQYRPEPQHSELSGAPWYPTWDGDWLIQPRTVYR